MKWKVLSIEVELGLQGHQIPTNFQDSRTYPDIDNMVEFEESRNAIHRALNA